jgi:glutamine amidotransferase
MTPLEVAVIDHGMGNLRSVARALEAAGARATVTSDPAEARRAGALCVPGQGIFGRCATALVRSGFAELIAEHVAADRPYLGICLGMQVLYEGSDEDPGIPGLGLLGGRVVRLKGEVVIPHIGWNTVGDTYYYFDHSFAVEPAEPDTVTGWCEHGLRFAAQVERGSLLAVQFHPEKSSRAGLALLERWLAA